MLRSLRLGLLLACLAPAALAQSAAAPALRVPPTLRTLPLADAPAPRIDGVPDEPVWATAPRAGDFVQRIPAPGDPATERTEAAVLYGDDALYVAFWCYVRDPGTLVARLARRDEFVGSDRVAVAFDFQFWNDRLQTLDFLGTIPRHHRVILVVVAHIARDIFLL